MKNLSHDSQPQGKKLNYDIWLLIQDYYLNYCNALQLLEDEKCRGS